MCAKRRISKQVLDSIQESRCSPFIRQSLALQAVPGNDRTDKHLPGLAGIVLSRPGPNAGASRYHVHDRVTQVRSNMFCTNCVEKIVRKGLDLDQSP